MLTLVLLACMLFMGAFALLRGRIELTAHRVVSGGPARLIGAILLLPLPLSLVSGLIVNSLRASRTGNSPNDDWQIWLEAAIEFAPFAVCAAAAVMIAAISAKSPSKAVGVD